MLTRPDPPKAGKIVTRPGPTRPDPTRPDPTRPDPTRPAGPSDPWTTLVCIDKDPFFHFFAIYVLSILLNISNVQVLFPSHCFILDSTNRDNLVSQCCKQLCIHSQCSNCAKWSEGSGCLPTNVYGWGCLDVVGSDDVHMEKLGDSSRSRGRTTVHPQQFEHWAPTIS